MGLPKIKTSSEFREKLSETINEVNDGEEQIISHKSGNVVLISQKHYSKMLKELGDLKDIATGIAEIDSGKVVSHSKALSRISDLKKRWSKKS